MCQKKIMRKRSHDSSWDEPPKKRISPSGNVLPIKISPGEVITDLTGKQWKLGKSIGCGGFGDIYLASDNVKMPVKNNAKYIAKVESHSNGPLFVEINCFLRIAKKEMIEDWKSEHQMKSLGMPHYVASGSHNVEHEKLRFLIMPRYDDDLEKIFMARRCKFNLKTVLEICTQVMDILEYIHSKGYVHCDIKASNILRSSETIVTTVVQRRPDRELRPNRNRNYFLYYNAEYAQPKLLCSLRPKRNVRYDELSEDDEPELTQCTRVASDRVYLIDYGLASKYRLLNGQHKQYCNDERRAHAGTVLFCSLDAHLGAQSRRSDLESLGYNMVYWLASALPWDADVDNPEVVQTKKQACLQDLGQFLTTCFTDYPSFLLDYFQYVKTLTFEAKPDYSYCKRIFRAALQHHGYKLDSRFDFDNVEGWGWRPGAAPAGQPADHKHTRHRTERPPLTCNLLLPQPAPPKKKVTRKKKLHWSKILSDPETILRQSNREVFQRTRDQKPFESGDGAALHNLNIWDLNPTYAMLDIFNKCRDRNGNYSVAKGGRGDSLHYVSRNGYTPAMCHVLSKMLRNQTSEVQRNPSSRRTKATKLNMYNSDFKDVKRKVTRQIRRYGLRN